MGTEDSAVTIEDLSTDELIEIIGRDVLMDKLRPSFTEELVLGDVQLDADKVRQVVREMLNDDLGRLAVQDALLDFYSRRGAA